MLRRGRWYREVADHCRRRERETHTHIVVVERHTHIHREEADHCRRFQEVDYYILVVDVARRAELFELREEVLHESHARL